MELSLKQQYELLAAISARGEIPVKFVYLGEGAQRWDAVYQLWRNDSGITDEEFVLLDSHIDAFLSVFNSADGVNLVDLGCGNGLPAIYLLEALQRTGCEVTYTAVDLSATMIDSALRNIDEKLPEVKREHFQLDFEKEALTEQVFSIKQRTGFPNLLVNLGNTLGNYVNANAVLTNVLEAMSLDDYLLLGNGLSNDQNPQRIINMYNTDLIIECVTSPARELGIFGRADEFRYVWNAPLARLEGRIKLGENKQLELAGQTTAMYAGDELLVHRSHKYTEASLMRLLSDVGFRTELLTTNASRGYLLTLIQPTRYSTN